MSSAELMAHIGQRVRARRRFLGLSRRELSLKSGVSVATINRLEKYGVATLQMLVKLAITLRSVDTLQDVFKNPPARTLDEYEKLIKTQG